MILALSANYVLLLLGSCSLVLLSECIVLFKGFIPKSGPHLEDKIPQVRETERVFRLAKLHKNARLRESLRLHVTVLGLQEDAVTILQDDVDVDPAFFVHNF